MLFANILRDTFSVPVNTNLSYFHFFVFMLAFISIMSGSCMLINFIWNKIQKR